MTTQEAIKRLQFMRDVIERRDWVHINDARALDMAIEALKHKADESVVKVNHTKRINDTK